MDHCLLKGCMLKIVSICNCEWMRKKALLALQPLFYSFCQTISQWALSHTCSKIPCCWLLCSFFNFCSLIFSYNVPLNCCTPGKGKIKRLLTRHGYFDLFSLLQPTDMRVSCSKQSTRIASTQICTVVLPFHHHSMFFTFIEHWIHIKVQKIFNVEHVKNSFKFFWSGICFENMKQISHVVQIKTTKTIRMGWHCTVVCEYQYLAQGLELTETHVTGAQLIAMIMWPADPHISFHSI